MRHVAVINQLRCFMSLFPVWGKIDTREKNHPDHHINIHPYNFGFLHNEAELQRPFWPRL